ncbi:hypothetical protein EOD42_02270 [Rhodovarius crocodyli]|uniref:P/Homo B domain-containing protein n=1 Tax=Rhodovarius crocodyli TaxID=1979269 RepID=A0A437MMT0_9PROT|nr:S8 family serine peptidase [Rhodovarius crocodyli]RVT98957.1 hypothetical protein EOD42_02270 [Rhodovarius crocodyli]
MVSTPFLPTDPLYLYAWHLKNVGGADQGNGVAGVDIRAEQAWMRYTGKNVLVAVLDDGVEASHPDLAANMWTRPGSIATPSDPNLANGLPVSSGRDAAGDNHGTSVAGVIAGVANNGIGGVGVAPDAQIVSYRILGEEPADTDKAFLQALADGVQVLNNSWGATAGMVLNTADLFAAIRVVTEGRAGLGAVIVKSAGNSRTIMLEDQPAPADANLDIVAASHASIVVAALDNTGVISSYSTPGANVFVSAFGGPGDSELTARNSIVSTDRAGPVNGYSDGDYTGFNGTSAAAPIVSGVVALMLEANARLGYRDVQEILAYTARQTDYNAGIGADASMSRTPWLTNTATNANGGGLNFSRDYGFGIVDAGAAVRLAETWTLQRTETNYITTALGPVSTPSGTSITAGGLPAAQTLTLTFNATAPVGASTGFRINSVELGLELSTLKAADISLVLTSPGGTSVTMLLANSGLLYAQLAEDVADPTRPVAWESNGWLFSSPAFWGESGVGEWQLVITAAAGAQAASFTGAELKLLGDGAAQDAASKMQVFTDDFARLAGLDASRAILGRFGETGLNAAGLSTAVTIDLGALDGNQTLPSYIGSQAVTFSGSTITDAWGGAGNDMLIGSGAANRLFGGWGDDYIHGGAGDDALDGGIGHDTLLGGTGDDTLTGGEGDDLLIGGTGHDTLVGGSGNDTYALDDADTVVEAADGGTDTAYVAFNDWVAAAHVEILYLAILATRLTGNDTGAILVANPTIASTLTGGIGHDVLWGGSADDVLNGGGGDDVLIGGAGADTMTGGTGDDTYVVDDIGDRVIEEAGGGNDTAFVTVNGFTLGAGIELTYLYGATSITGSASDEVIVADAVLGGTLHGGGGQDVLWGQAGNDNLFGDEGNDILRGGAGDDVLNGGAGNDQLVGGTGADTFVFSAGHDELFDFSRAEGDLISVGARGVTGLEGMSIQVIGGNTVILIGEDRMDVYGVTNLAAQDFMFAA